MERLGYQIGLKIGPNLATLVAALCLIGWVICPNLVTMGTDIHVMPAKGCSQLC